MHQFGELAGELSNPRGSNPLPSVKPLGSFNRLKHSTVDREKEVRDLSWG